MTKTNTNTNSKATDATITLKEAVELSGLSSVYVRRAVLEGKLPSTKVPVGDTKVVRHEIKMSDFEAWRASTTHRGRRSDGRNRYLLYGTPEEIEALKKLLADSSIEVQITVPNSKRREAKTEVENA